MFDLSRIISPEMIPVELIVAAVVAGFLAAALSLSRNTRPITLGLDGTHPRSNSTP